LRKLGKTVRDRPKCTLWGLREEDISRIIVANFGIEKLTRTMKELGFVVGTTFSCSMKKKDNGIFFV
jgi:hypothetical protein